MGRKLSGTPQASIQVSSARYECSSTSQNKLFLLSKEGKNKTKHGRVISRLIKDNKNNPYHDERWSRILY